jgi:drug/metabolite transporter (DMT)-like permease
LAQSTLTEVLEQITGRKIAVMHPQLLAAGIFFSLGFLTTNYAFRASAASFVETIKASEPISSALLAHLWQIEILGRAEITSLGTIVAGVVFSTLGHGSHHHVATTSSTVNAAVTNNAPTTASLLDSLYTCLIVFVANFCFSFRGLFQKLFRANSGMVLDDLNLQFRMQQVGVAMLVIPAAIREWPSILAYWWNYQQGRHDGSFGHFILLSIINGLAFTGYNLASTFILSRISVVHHATLNCLRRVFAVVCTSIYFQVPLTLSGIFGIGLSTAGFLSFTHYKVQRQRQPKPLSSLLPVSLNQQSPG